MHTVDRLLTNIQSTDLSASKDFYTHLFKFEVRYDSDWFIHLAAPDTNLELGLIQAQNELIPEGFQASPSGFISHL